MGWQYELHRRWLDCRRPGLELLSGEGLVFVRLLLSTYFLRCSVAFTRAWDESFPPDTQNANLLGDDIRKFKVDVRERITAFGAGVVSARETPEAAYGDANKGVAFFATDELKLYRWSGSGWITAGDFSGIETYLSDVASHVITNPGVETVGSAVNIQANQLRAGSVVSIEFRAIEGGSGGTPDQNLYFGGVLVAKASVDTNGCYGHALVYVTGAATQKGIGFGVGSGVTPLRTHSAPVEPINAIIPVTLACAANGAAAVTHDLLVVRYKF